MKKYLSLLIVILCLYSCIKNQRQIAELTKADQALFGKSFSLESTSSEDSRQLKNESSKRDFEEFLHYAREGTEQSYRDFALQRPDSKFTNSSRISAEAVYVKNTLPLILAEPYKSKRYFFYQDYQERCPKGVFNTLLFEQISRERAKRAGLQITPPAGSLIHTVTAMDFLGFEKTEIFNTIEAKKGLLFLLTDDHLNYASSLGIGHDIVKVLLEKRIENQETTEFFHQTDELKGSFHEHVMASISGQFQQWEEIIRRLQPLLVFDEEEGAAVEISSMKTESVESTLTNILKLIGFLKSLAGGTTPITLFDGLGLEINNVDGTVEIPKDCWTGALDSLHEMINQKNDELLRFRMKLPQLLSDARNQTGSSRRKNILVMKQQAIDQSLREISLLQLDIAGLANFKFPLSDIVIILQAEDKKIFKAPGSNLKELKKDVNTRKKKGCPGQPGQKAADCPKKVGKTWGRQTFPSFCRCHWQAHIRYAVDQGFSRPNYWLLFPVGR